MKLWRCRQCKREFEALKPACGACGIDPEANAAERDLIAELVPIHFDPPTRVPGAGRNHAACDPKLRPGAPKCQFTSEPAAVTCPRCKGTEAFAAAGGESNGASEKLLSRAVGPAAG